MQSFSITADGSVEVRASSFHFVVAGLGSATAGALLSWLAKTYLSWSLLPFSILVVFGFWTLRSLVQGLFVPRLLTVRIGTSAVSGPCVWWVMRDSIEVKDIDWQNSGLFAGRLIICGPDSQRIYTRLKWYGSYGSSQLQSLWEDLCSRYGESAALHRFN